MMFVKFSTVCLYIFQHELLILVFSKEFDVPVIWTFYSAFYIY